MALAADFATGKVRATPNRESSASFRRSADSDMSRISAVRFSALYSSSVKRVFMSKSSVLRDMSFSCYAAFLGCFLAAVFCSSSNADPISKDSRLPRWPCAKALISDSEQLQRSAISARFRPCCSKEEITLDQFMNVIRYDCIVDCKQNDTKVANKTNTIVSMDTLASRLKAARNEAGLSQDELAVKAGMTRGGIGHLETGRRDGSTHLPKIADALGVNALWLAEGKGPKEPLKFPVLEKMQSEPQPDDFLPSEMDYVDVNNPGQQEIINEIASREIPEGIREAILTLVRSSPKKKNTD